MSSWKIYTKSPEETQKVGEILGSSLVGGEIIELVSDIGGGKTTMTKGVAKGLGIEGNVSSPTFTLSKIYKGRLQELHHYDFYRLSGVGIMEEDIKEVISNIDNITVVEWARDVHNLFPQDRTIRIELNNQVNEKHRIIKVFLPDNLNHIATKLGATKC